MSMKMNQNSILDRTLRRKQEIVQSKQALPWVIVNLIFALLVYWDMCQNYLIQYFALPLPVIWYSELFLTIVFVLNAIVNLITYLKPSLTNNPVELTPRQKILLAVNDDDSGFTSPKLSPIGQIPETKTNFSISTSSLLTSTPFSLSSGSPLSSPNTTGSPLSTTGSSWTYYPNQSYTPLHRSHAQEPSLIDTVDNQFYGSSFIEGRNLRMRSLSHLNDRTANKPIHDEASLHKYLAAYELEEQKRQIALAESPPALGTSFWSLGHTLLDYSPLLRKYAYQLASRSSQSTASRSDNDPDSPIHHVGEEVWKKLGVTSEQLNGWTKNLRQWINVTILERLIGEIANINEILRRMGSPDLQIGEVNLSTLRQVSLTKSQLIPNLNILLPYLEVTPNQEYLIQRIHELANGGCMSEYTWNGGGKFKGKPWGDHLPTDAAIIIHLFCTYLDSRLPPHPNHPDGKTFTNQHFIKTPDKPDLTKDSVCFFQSKISPPHFKLIIRDEVWDLRKGHNNLFHSILLFLYHIKTRENGMFGRVNFGLSGINALWILD